MGIPIWLVDAGPSFVVDDGEKTLGLKNFSQECIRSARYVVGRSTVDDRAHARLSQHR